VELAVVDAVQIAATLARRFEGLYLTPYLCPAGVATCGYGATFYEDGTRVRLTDPPITRERAEALLLWMLRTVYLPTVVKLCPGVDNPKRLAALIDFTFNLGQGNLKASTLRRRVNAGNWDAVPAELRKWTRGGGRVLRGLVLRREAEIAILQ
jgi:lysozyme